MNSLEIIEPPTRAWDTEPLTKAYADLAGVVQTLTSAGMLTAEIETHLTAALSLVRDDLDGYVDANRH